MASVAPRFDGSVASAVKLLNLHRPPSRSPFSARDVKDSILKYLIKELDLMQSRHPQCDIWSEGFHCTACHNFFAQTLVLACDAGGVTFDFGFSAAEARVLRGMGSKSDLPKRAPAINARPDPSEVPTPVPKPAPRPVAPVAPKSHGLPAVVGDPIQVALSGETKNDTIRRLLLVGYEVKVIATMMGLTYQRVKNVEKADRKKLEAKLD